MHTLLVLIEYIPVERVSGECRMVFLTSYLDIVLEPEVDQYLGEGKKIYLIPNIIGDGPHWCYCHRVPMLVIQQVQHSFSTKVKEDLSLSKQYSQPTVPNRLPDSHKRSLDPI